MAQRSSSKLLPPEAVFGALLDWLAFLEAPGLIIGGVAASLLGRPRLTQDVDVLILLDESRWEEFVASGRRFGFVPRIRDAVAFAQQARVFLLRHEPSDVDIDIAIGGLPFEIQSIEQVRHRKYGKLSLPLPTPENLIVMKAVAHRPKDMEDILAIVETYPNLNVRRIRNWLKEFAAALDMPDVLNDVEKLLSRAHGKKSPRAGRSK